METTPNDLRQQQFEIKFRGYNSDDVEVFRELAADALEESRAKVLQLAEENNHLNERLKYLVEIEDTLKAAVLEAQKNSESTLAVAQKEADSMIAAAEKEKELTLREAKHLRDEVVADMHRRMGKLVNDINKIRFIRNNYLVQFKSLLSSHTEMLDRAMADEEKEKKNQDIPKPPKYEPPESGETPEMHVEKAKPEADEPEVTEEASAKNPPEKKEDKKPEPPAGDKSAEDEWQHLKEQLSED
jgi:cell division initiation protein